MAMDYTLLKAVHLGTVVLSIGGFALRGAASLAGAAWVRGRWARTLPHGVDTVLLGSAIGLAVMASFNPLHTPWLLAKLLGLLLYIVLGALALRPGLPRAWRAGAWLAALGTVGWIVSVALTKSPWGWFG